MSEASKIEWTDATWNPVRGCTRISEGCRNCYAERIAVRMSGPGQWGEGFADAPSRHSQTGAATTGVRGKWTGKVALIPSALDRPLRWRKPRRIFVNSMSDLFHEALPFEQIAAVYGVMACAPHTFQVLTKRPARRLAFHEWLREKIDRSRGVFPDDPDGWIARHLVTNRARHFGAPGKVQPSGDEWPLPNVWEGVSVEDQATADDRIPLLLQTPAAVRFVSYEPGLGPVDFDAALLPLGGISAAGLPGRRGIDWIIVGGESGPGARPFNVGWALDVIQQGQDAGVAVFYKQGGSSNRCEHSGKGGCQDCMPPALRVREFPA